jgi:hypothetical protein
MKTQTGDGKLDFYFYFDFRRNEDGTVVSFTRYKVANNYNCNVSCSVMSKLYQNYYNTTQSLKYSASRHLEIIKYLPV